MRRRAKSEGTFYLVECDVVILVDDGTGSVDDYESLARVAKGMCRDCPNGFGLLVVIPSHARPPTDQARNIISETMEQCGSRLRCVCWLVEGRGFQAAMVRAVLNGLRLLARRNFEASVETELLSALRQLYETLRGSELTAVRDAQVTARVVRRERLRRAELSESA